MSEVIITWKAGFGRTLDSFDHATLTRLGVDATTSQSYILPLPTGGDMAALEALFEATNLYSGPLWERMVQQGMPPRRHHTALSVGDEVTLHGKTWRCTPIGWEVR